jgi:hypothetical protein
MSGIENDDRRAQEQIDYALTTAPHECVYQEADGTTTGVCYLPGAHGGRLRDSERERHPDPERVPYNVDCSGQSLVWALTASQHATELMQYTTERKERRDRGDVLAPEYAHRLLREIEYHQEMHGIAKGLADMWALTASVQPFMSDDSYESGQARKLDA